MLSRSSDSNEVMSTAQEEGRRRRRRIVDTDAGFDDVVAIQCLLAHGYSVDLATTVCGSNTASVTWQGMQRLFPHLEIIASPDRPRESLAWLTDFRRRFRDFVDRHGTTTTTIVTKTDSTGDHDRRKDLSLKMPPSPPSSLDIIRRVGQFLQDSDDEGVDLICLGPLSNIADWCQHYPDLMSAKVADIWILGGAHPNTGRDDEFNFGQDAAAAAHVLDVLGHKVHLVPGDVTSHHMVSESYIASLVEQVHAESTDANLLANVIKEEQQYSMFYDPVCAFLYLNREMAQFARIPLQVCSQTSVTKMILEETSARPIIHIAQQVDFEAYRSWLLHAIRQSEEATHSDNSDTVK